MFDIFKIILVVSLVSLLVTGFLKMFIFDQFFNDKSYYLKGCDILKIIVIIETIGAFGIGLCGMLIMIIFKLI